MYEIDGNSSERTVIDGVSYSQWKIVKDGVMIATLSGPGSASAAVAACERLNNVREKWDWYGWTERLHKLFVPRKD